MVSDQDVCLLLCKAGFFFFPPLNQSCMSTPPFFFLSPFSVQG